MIGPWLGYFTKIVFDRWSSILSALDIEEVSKTILLNNSNLNKIPNDFSEFRTLCINDSWNYSLFEQILTQKKAIKFIKSEKFI